MKNIIISNAIGYNKFLDAETLKNKPIIYILRFCHPIDREDFANKLNLSKEEKESLRWKWKD